MINKVCNAVLGSHQKDTAVSPDKPNFWQFVMSFTPLNTNSSLLPVISLQKGGGYW